MIKIFSKRNLLKRNLLDRNLLDRNLLKRNLHDRNLLDIEIFSIEIFLKKIFLEETFLEESFLEETFLEETLLKETFLEETFFKEIFLEKSIFSKEIFRYLKCNKPFVYMTILPCQTELQVPYTFCYAMLCFSAKIVQFLHGNWQLLYIFHASSIMATRPYCSSTEQSSKVLCLPL